MRGASMQKTELFIAGGTVPGCWAPDPDFKAIDKITLYEAAMALAGMHPYAGWIAGLCCHTDDLKADDLKAKTLAGMGARERAVSTWPRPLAIYRALRAQVSADRLRPLRRRALCIDHQGVQDHTRDAYSLDEVLAWYAARSAAVGAPIKSSPVANARDTVSNAELTAAMNRHGPGTEAQLCEAMSRSFPNKHIPRRWRREARVQLFGKPKRGRPPTRDKSPDF
jgi:hypothetical protein